MSLKSIFNWAVRRLKEKSTYVGIATVAVAVGAPRDVVDVIGQAGQIAALIFGGGLMAASTIPRVPEPGR